MNTRFQKITYAMMTAALALLAGCDGEEISTNLPGDAPSDNAYPPLVITGVTMATEGESEPQTRVYDYGDRHSRWDAGDQIHVLVSWDGDVNTESICTLDNNNKITTSNPALVWKKNTTATIDGWYAYPDENGTVDLSDQSRHLAYVLKAYQVSATYPNEVWSLSFVHQLAKIRIGLRDSEANSVRSVTLESYTSCTHERGTLQQIDPQTTSVGTIYMKQEKIYEDIINWEANVVPGKEISQIKIDDKIYKLTQTITPEAGKLYTVKVSSEYPIIYINDYSSTDNYITISGNPILTGSISSSFSNKKPILIEDGATVTLRNVHIGRPLLCKGNVTLILKNLQEGQNENSIATIYVETGGTLTIQGDDEAVLNAYEGILAQRGANIRIEGGTINAKAGGITSYYDRDNPLLDVTPGDITITGGIIYAQGSSYGAGIGTTRGGVCGTIRIEGGTITAEGGGYDAPGIGAGEEEIYPNGEHNGGTFDQIIITGGTVNATGAGYAPAIGYINNIKGKITISGGDITVRKGPNAKQYIGSGFVDGSTDNVTIDETKANITYLE